MLAAPDGPDPPGRPLGRPLFVPPGGGPGGVKAAADATGHALGLVETSIPPGHSTPLHVHREEDEAFYVLSGTVDFICGDERFRGTAGAFAYLPRDVPHSFLGVGDEPARCSSWSYRPASRRPSPTGPVRGGHATPARGGRGATPRVRYGRAITPPPLRAGSGTPWGRCQPRTRRPCRQSAESGRTRAPVPGSASRTPRPAPARCGHGG
jgi:quercetin dioxygenase-like cupin family protein